jgi:hypothetical protein
MISSARDVAPLIGEDGRAPDPAYQQVQHGVPAADFSADELMYLPRNVRSRRLDGKSPVEQVAMTISIALRRETATLEYYNSGSAPDACSNSCRAISACSTRASRR